MHTHRGLSSLVLAGKQKWHEMTMSHFQCSSRRACQPNSARVLPSGKNRLSRRVGPAGWLAGSLSTTPPPPFFFSAVGRASPPEPGIHLRARVRRKPKRAQHGILTHLCTHRAFFIGGHLPRETMASEKRGSMAEVQATFRLMLLLAGSVGRLERP